MAGRIASLKQDIERALSSHPHGSPRYVKQRRYTLLALVNALQAINCLVPRLSHLNKFIIQKLIQYWQEQGNSVDTICHKISILRNVCKQYLITNPIPINRELGIADITIKKVVSFNPATAPVITDPTIEHLYRLQRYFGLKLSEALKMESYMFDESGLRMARAVAYNKKNRFIPYWCEEQKQFYRDSLQDLKFTKNHKKLLSLQHKAILQQANIVDKEYYRYQYIYHRYQHLLGHDSNLHNVLKQLRSETGYKENRQIKAILKYQNVV